LGFRRPPRKGDRFAFGRQDQAGADHPIIYVETDEKWHAVPEAFLFWDAMVKHMLFATEV
jgi:hypothetical protein